MTFENELEVILDELNNTLEHALNPIGKNKELIISLALKRLGEFNGKLKQKRNNGTRVILYTPQHG